jgi:hypothetical protein
LAISFAASIASSRLGLLVMPRRLGSSSYSMKVETLT